MLFQRGTISQTDHLDRSILILPQNPNLNRRRIRLRRLKREERENRFVFQLVTLVILLLVLCSSLLAGALKATIWFVNQTNADYGRDLYIFQELLPKDNLKILDSHGILIYQCLDQGIQTSIPLNGISKYMIDAEIATEDKTFWSNPGVDVFGLLRAAQEDLLHDGVIQGGSSITQQLVKNVLVGAKQDILRKLREIVLSPELSRVFSKNEILQMYLNTVYYGEQSYGANAAAHTYFGLSDDKNGYAASKLDIAQAAMLAGIPSNPSLRNPFLHPVAAFSRFLDVIHSMYLQGYITHVQMMSAIIEAQNPRFLNPGTYPNLAMHFVSYTLHELTQIFHMQQSDLSRSGYIVHTTLDLGLQEQIKQIAKRNVNVMRAEHNMHNSAQVLINYRDGAIKTLIGSIDPKYPYYDVATQGLRQSGSSFKPFIYATALSQGVITPNTILEDEPLTVQMCCGLPAYSPQNYDGRFHGSVTVRYALQNSFNIPAVRVLLMMKNGVQESLITAQKMGISEFNGVPNLTMVLGTLGVHLLDETSAFGVFGNNGVRVLPYSIETITLQGTTIYKHMVKGIRVLSSKVAKTMTSILSDNASRRYEFGLCSELALYTHTQQQCYAGNPGVIIPSAAKTGTSQNFTDNWIVGYTGNGLVMGVWCGNDNNTPMNDIIGVSGAGPIWQQSMLLINKGQPIVSMT